MWIVSIGLLIIILDAVLYRGGNNELSRAVICSATPLIFILRVFLGQVAHGRLHKRLNHFPWIALWVSVMSAILFAQLARSFGLGNLDLVINANFLTLLPTADTGDLSWIGIRGVVYLAMFSSYLMIAWITYTLPFKHLQFLLTAVAVLAVFQALYGISIHMNGQQIVLGTWRKVHYLQDVTGTFINRNHFASFIALCWPLCLAITAHSRKHTKSPLRSRIALMIAIFTSLLFGLAVASSHSRLGFVVSLIGLWVWFVLQKKTRNSNNEILWIRRWVGTGFIIVIFLGGVWFGIETLVERFIELPDAQSRLLVWESMLGLPLEVWVVGIGPGSFEDFFKLVQPAALVKVYDYAHSDLLQFLLEIGVLGSAYILITAIWGLRKLRPSKLEPLHIGLIGGLIAVAIHSIGDFPLHIPGVAVLFWIFIGALGNPELKKARTHQRQDKYD